MEFWVLSCFSTYLSCNMHVCLTPIINNQETLLFSLMKQHKWYILSQNIARPTWVRLDLAYGCLKRLLLLLCQLALEEGMPMGHDVLNMGTGVYDQNGKLKRKIQLILRIKTHAYYIFNDTFFCLLLFGEILFLSCYGAPSRVMVSKHVKNPVHRGKIRKINQEKL